MPESKDNSPTDAVEATGNGSSPNGASGDAAAKDADSVAPAVPAGSGDAGEPEAAEAETQADPLEQAKEDARERARGRKRMREERKVERRAQGKTLSQRFERMRSGEGWRRPRADGQPRPKIKKLRALLVLLGLGLLAIVSWVFGVMMAVAQDLPDLEARSQYDAAQNSV